MISIYDIHLSSQIPTYNIICDIIPTTTSFVHIVKNYSRISLSCTYILKINVRDALLCEIHHISPFSVLLSPFG